MAAAALGVRAACRRAVRGARTDQNRDCAVRDHRRCGDRYANDKGGTFPGMSQSGQMDCIDESINTTIYLRMLQNTACCAGTAWRIGPRAGRSSAAAHHRGDRGAQQPPALGGGLLVPRQRQAAFVLPLETWKSGWQPPQLDTANAGASPARQSSERAPRQPPARRRPRARLIVRPGRICACYSKGEMHEYYEEHRSIRLRHRRWRHRGLPARQPPVRHPRNTVLLLEPAARMTGSGSTSRSGLPLLYRQPPHRLVLQDRTRPRTQRPFDPLRARPRARWQLLDQRHALTCAQQRDYDEWARRTGDPGWSWQGVLPIFRKSEDHWRGADEFTARARRMKQRDTSGASSASA